jgi:FkbM family methyltransferase
LRPAGTIPDVEKSGFVRRHRPRLSTIMETPPVLLLAFNRPDLARKVFEAIRAARPARLFIAVDGAREHKPGESEAVAEAQRLACEVDWPCEVHTRFLEKNHGCKFAISGAISWFFEHVEEGVILEEDCIPGASFFPYCAAMLERYRGEERVGLVSGDNFAPPKSWGKRGHGFTRYAFIWGWATWRRAWRKFDRDLVDWPARRDSGWLSSLGLASEEARHWRGIFDLCYGGRRYDSWAFPWMYSCWKAGMLCVYPAANLVSNVGFDERGTHTTQSGDSNQGVPIGELEDPLPGPSRIEADPGTDRLLARRYYKVRHVKAVARASRWFRRTAARLGNTLAATFGGRRKGLRARLALLRSAGGGAGEVRLDGVTWAYADAESFAGDFERIWMQGRYDFQASGVVSPLVIDCGAGVGVGVLAWKRRVPGVRVIALEASSELFSLLRRNVEGGGGEGVELRRQALAAQVGKARFLAFGNGKGHVVSGLPKESAQNLEDVEAASLESVIGQQEVSLLKLSVEGAEEALLSVSPDTLRRVARVYVDHVMPTRREQRLDEMLALLRGAGFRVHVQTETLSPRPFVLRGEEEGTLQRVQLFAYRNG